jgi:FSR family fosmidomycin resistance protein-like MFS transporter
VFGAREAAWPLLRDDLSLSYAQIGVLLAVPGVVSVFVEPVLFVLGDVWRRRALVLGGGVAFAGALVLAGVSTTFVLLLAAFTLLYPASGAFVSLSQATLMDAEPERREENMTRWTIAGAAGAVAGPGALALAVFLGLGWRGLFVAFAALALVLVVLAARVELDHRPDGAERPHVLDALRALRRRDVVRWLVLLELSDLLLDVLLGYLALYFVDEVGAGEGAAGAAVATFTAAGLVGSVLVLRLLRRVDGLRYLRASAWAALALFVVFLVVDGAAPKVALLALLGLVNAGWYPVLQARLYDALPDRSGTALAVGSLVDLPASLLPLALGLVAERWGLEAALWLLAAAPLSLLALVPRRRRS